MTKPLVSVVTPSYNQISFIGRTIESVINQTYPNVEHVIVDGGSRDGTLELLKNYEDKYNMRWISEPDQGQSQAINKGFRMSEGEIIGWVNSDDTLEPDAAERAVNYISINSNVDWVFGDCLVIDENDQILFRQTSQKFDLKKLITEKQYIFQPTVFFNERILKEIGFIDERLHFTMDYDFFIRLGLSYQSRYIPHVMASRRIHSDAKTVKADVAFEEEAIKTLKKVFKDNRVPKDILSCKNQAFSNRYFRKGIGHFNKGLYKEARRDLYHAVKVHPELFFSRKGVIGILVILQSWIKWSIYQPKGRFDQDSKL